MQEALVTPTHGFADAVQYLSRLLVAPIMQDSA